MKHILDYINEAVDKENFPFSGTFKKGDTVVVFFLDDDITDENVNTVKVNKINIDNVDKVVSKQLARYSRDNHTWVYANANEDGDPLRFELVSYGENLYQGIIDYDYKRNFKGTDEFCAVIMNAKMAKDILTNKPKKYDLTSIDINGILKYLQ